MTAAPPSTALAEIESLVKKTIEVEVPSKFEMYEQFEKLIGGCHDTASTERENDVLRIGHEHGRRWGRAQGQADLARVILALLQNAP